jgi:hypothetical protein
MTSVSKDLVVKRHFAIDGDSFEKIRNKDPELLKRVIEKKKALTINIYQTSLYSPG